MSTFELFVRIFNGLPLGELLAIERALVVTIEAKRKAIKPRKTPKPRKGTAEGDGQ